MMAVAVMTFLDARASLDFKLSVHYRLQRILPTIGECMSVEFKYWYWTYSANN